MINNIVYKPETMMHIIKTTSLSVPAIILPNDNCNVVVVTQYNAIRYIFIGSDALRLTEMKFQFYKDMCVSSKLFLGERM